MDLSSITMKQSFFNKVISDYTDDKTNILELHDIHRT